MKNRLLIFFGLLIFSVTVFSQPRLYNRRVAIYVDKETSTLLDATVHKNIRGTFLNILKANGYEVEADSLAEKIAHELKKQNDIKTGTKQISPKVTTVFYVFSTNHIDNSLQLSVSVIGVGEENYQEEIQNEKSYIPFSLFIDNQINSTDLLTYEVANALGLLDNYAVGRKMLEDLARWKSETDYITDSEKKKYTALSFLPPVNQFRSHTSKGTANGIAILTGYGVSVGTFIWSTTAYAANKRKLENISVDLSEADKAKDYYKGQMDICRGGQIASSILFLGSYIFGVANALTNRDSYQKKTNFAISPAALENGAGIALLYNF